MRICIVHRYPLRTAASTNPSLPLVIQQLISSNHSVFYLSYSPASSEGELLLPGLTRLTLPSSYQRSRPADLIPKSLLFVVLAPIVLAKHRPSFDITYCDDALPVYGFLAKVMTRSKVVYRMGDYMTGYLSSSPSFLMRFLGCVLSKLEFKMLGRIDRVLPISNTMREFLTTQGLSPDRISVVTECVDIDNRSKENGLAVRTELGVSSDEILLMFHGLIAPWKSVDLLIPALARLKRSHSKTKLAIIGDGPSLESLKSKAKIANLQNDIIFTGWIPSERVPDYISACDVGIVLRGGSAANSFILTTALMQYLAMSKPLVAPNLKSISELVPKQMLFQPDDAEDLASRLEHIVDNLEGSHQDLQAASRTIRSRYSAESVGKDLVRSLLETPE